MPFRECTSTQARLGIEPSPIAMVVRVHTRNERGVGLKYEGLEYELGLGDGGALKYKGLQDGILK